MGDPAFHDSEIETFLTECADQSLSSDDLLMRVKEDITEANLRNSSNSARRKLRDMLQDRGVPCGRGSGDSIQTRLLSLITNVPTNQPQTSAPSTTSHPFQGSLPVNAKRDILKVSRNDSEKFSGPYEGPIIDVVKRRFIQDCDAFDLPHEQRLSVMHTILKGDALEYFTEFVCSTVTSCEDAFDKLQEHFMTPAHRDTYTTEWNTLTFRDMKNKHGDKSPAHLLDLLFQRARELQSLLGSPYNSPLLLRDCIIRAVKNEKFYTPLITANIPQDPNALQTRLHQCIRQIETSSTNLVPSSSSNVYLTDTDADELNLHYNANNPFFKRQIMRGSNSFSSPNYGRQYNSRGRFYGNRGRFNRPYTQPQKRVSFAPNKNPRDSSGRIMLCRFCNSWFHLERNCIEKNRMNYHYGNIDMAQEFVANADNSINVSEPTSDFDQCVTHVGYSHAINLDRSLDEYNFTPTAEPEVVVNHPNDAEENEPTAHRDACFLNLAYHIEHEFESPPNEYSTHILPNIPPDNKTLRKLHPTIQVDDNVPFHGLCFDEGAPQSVTGANQWMAYLRSYHLPDHLKKIEPIQTEITFGGKGKNRIQVNTIGVVTIRMPLPAYSYFDFKSLLIQNDVPMLLGLSTQTKLSATTTKDPTKPTVSFKTIGVTLPLKFKLGHLYYEPPEKNDYLFSMIELAQVHRNLGHAPPGSVYSALRRAYPIEAEASDLEKLQAITKQCKGCQLFSRQPNRYRAVLPDQCVFHYDVALDVMFYTKVPILHAVCRQTHFSRAALLPKQDSYTIWCVFMTIWVTPYLGVPFNLWVDQAKSFLSVQFKTLANSLGCNLVPIAVEAHWSLIAERYHDPMRRIVQKLVVDHPAAPLSLIVDYANMAMSHTIGPEGFTPAILAFGTQPRLPIGNYDQQPQSVVNRMDLMTTARREYEAIVAQLRIRRALHSAFPNEATAALTPGDEVLVYREKTGWEGPYTFLYNDGRLSVVLDSKGREHLFHSTMLKPYTRPNLPISDLLNPADESEAKSTIQTNLVQVVHDEQDARFRSSRQKEYDGIVKKGGVRPILRAHLPEDANFVGNRFVLTIKNPDSDEPIYKARWVLQGHQDRYRHSIANDSPMLMRLMFRVILSLAAIVFNFNLWTRDVEQAYMQSKPLQRNVYTEPPPEANLPQHQVLKVELPHYGLVEASSCFFDTYYPVFTEKLKMTCSPFDPCFLFRKFKGNLKGVSGLASDDSINTGNSDYQHDEEKATKDFITRKTDAAQLRFLGFNIFRSTGLISVHQSSHIDRLQVLSYKSIDQDLFRTIRGQLLFISQSSRPDVSYDVAQLCQIHYKMATAKNVKLLNEVVTHLKESKDLTLKYPKLDTATLKLYVIVDSGYNTNADGTSQLGVIVFITDDTNRCHFIHWSSSKCPRITRSMLASETYAFSTGYDYGVSLRMLFKQMSIAIPLYVFTDCKSIFDTITASKRLRELRLMNEIADIRRAYRVNEITNIAWIRSEQNAADNLTRRQGNAILNHAMTTGYLKFTIEQWVYKDKATSGLSGNWGKEKETNVM